MATGKETSMQEPKGRTRPAGHWNPNIRVPGLLTMEETSVAAVNCQRSQIAADEGAKPHVKGELKRGCPTCAAEEFDGTAWEALTRENI